MTVTITNQNSHYTLHFEGSLDSNNAPSVDKTIASLLPKKGVESLDLDCLNLSYVTSAGLRIFFSLWKKYPGMRIIDVRSEVYDILDMTGFTKMMKVSKALREVSVEGKPIIGEGFTAIVYRLTGDSIVKVFRGERSMEDIRAELEAAKEAFIYGIPTAMSFDIVKVGDRLGVVFEMLDCASLRDLILAHPENFDDYKKMYADLSYKITHTDARDSGLGECKGPLLKKFTALESVLTKKEYSKLIGMIEAIPDTGTLTHGDFHIKNILVQNGEPLLIDMDSVALGNPIFELEGIFLSGKAYNVAEPDNASSFFGVPQKQLDELYDALIQTYFPRKKGAELQRIYEKIELLGTAHLAYQTIRYKRDVNGRLDKALARLRELLGRYDDLDLTK